MNDTHIELEKGMMLFAAALFNSFICEQHHSFAPRCKPAARPDKEGIRPAIDRSVSISVPSESTATAGLILRTLPYYRQNPYRYYLNNLNLNEFMGNAIHYNRAENARKRHTGGTGYSSAATIRTGISVFSEKPIPILRMTREASDA
ncbi:MAG: hypothetical protein ACLT1W_16420 [Alistipes onderdonkii]